MLNSKRLFGAGMLICTGALLSIIILVLLSAIVPTSTMGFKVAIVGGCNFLLGFGAAGIMYEKWFIEND